MTVLKVHSIDDFQIFITPSQDKNIVRLVVFACFEKN